MSPDTTPRKSTCSNCPRWGSVLKWIETIPAPMHGQAWVFDPEDPKQVFGIIRSTGEVVVARLR